MSERSASILISKLTAAQRQIDAAVRMTLAGEDKLAVYTVAAAALKVLRDVMRKRGITLVEDRHLHTLVGLARRLIENEHSDVLDHIRENERPFYEAVELAATTIREAEEAAGKRVRAEDLFKVSASDAVELAYSQEVDPPANFLKHADRDVDGHWDDDGFDSERVLFDACDAYLSVMRRLTPEMLVYMTLLMIECGDGKTGDGRESFWGPMGPVATILKGVEPAERRSVSLNLLDEKRDILSDLLRVYEPGRGRKPDVETQQS